MKEISKQRNQLSGHLGIIAIPLNNIKSILGSEIECHDQALNYIHNCSRESISYSSPSQYSKAGNSINHKISATIIGYSSENDRLLQEMLRYQFVVFLQNAYGNYTRIGNQVKGLNFNYAFSTSPDPNGNNRYEVNFEGYLL